jgi:putative endonuclease
VPRFSKQYYVYMLTNRSHRTLYTGVTNDLSRRMHEHRRREVPGFTAKYNVDRLLHYETFFYVEDAIEREKEIKGWTRTKKEALVAEWNPCWEDLSPQVLDP